MELGERMIKVGENRTNEGACKLCGGKVEDMIHFIVKCETLEKCKDRRVMDPIVATGKILFRNEVCKPIHSMLEKMKRREYLMK